MKTYYLAAAGFLSGMIPFAATAEWRPLSEQSINSATLGGWRASMREAEAVAQTAEADPTMPDVTANGSDPSADAVGKAIDRAMEHGAGDEIDLPGVPDVPVSHADGLTIDSPTYSTDSPDQAGLEIVDEVAQPDPFVVRVQILLDRAHISPGAIDGLAGDNTHKAVRAFEIQRGLPADGELDEEVVAALEADAGPVIGTYRITDQDLTQRYVEQLPEDYAALAELDWLGFRSPSEMLAERFHMDEALLINLNPTADFQAVGTTILVADIGAEPVTKVAKIVVEKDSGQLTAYDDAGGIVLVAPATIGSADTPSPTGSMIVEAVAPEPTYSYDPENFVQGENQEPLTLPPGPNGPVGSVWIDLSTPSYGIHGTPEPGRIAKNQSHGCVRLTNWDAEVLSKLVEPKVTTVEFIEKRGV